MQFFLDDTDATPIRLFSANNAPHPRATRTFVARPPLARGNRSVPGYPYIRFVNDDDYDGSYPFDAFQDLRSAYSSSSLSDIQGQLRVLQQQRAQAQLRRALLEQQQQTIAQREHELLAYQRQLEKQRQEQARAASERARVAYLSRLREDEQQKQLENQRQAQKASHKNEAATSDKERVVFFPPFHFFDHILDSQFRSQDEVERRRAHKSALSDLLDLYFSDAAAKPTSESQSVQSVERESGPKAPAATPAASRERSVVGTSSDEQRALPYGARAQEPDPALLDNVLRVVHDRLAEIGAEEDAEKAKEAARETSPHSPTLTTDTEARKTKATPQNKADVDIVEEPTSSPPPTPSTKIPRNSPPIGSDVEVEEPTDYNRLARLLRNRVHGLGDEDVFVPLSTLEDNEEHSPEPDELPKATPQDEKDTQQEVKPAEDEANEHTDSEFADMLDDCKCQLREMKEADGKQDHQRATRRRHRRHNRKHKQSKRAKKAAEKQQQKQQHLAAEGPEEQRQRQAVKTIEDYVLGAKSKRVANQVRESLSELHHLELELDQIRKDYSRRVNDTQLSFVADKNGDLRLAYNRDNSAFHAYKDILQRLLLKLDTIPSYGDEVIRAKRRSIVVKIQDILDALDRLASDQESEQSASTPSDGAMADVSE
ncbi:hypothetical protein COEREDRAFT_79395 [Coemansia reversa NRRL 1564]|uniref:BAG domain-containing protein n=1 Tax=Coemansia reversa (strain ATCC 12441 / NRRL 1564) TaxID=763665 RepID=A0A2G5BII0_COERN|nr:hypothetical protein COEREDRAFT_79395 [Coemansia reversa NRRL 1564]|eukprot:PIA18834.1 hypothetical protein COEREDRAFT_79395 [Coemansia reversa NRRL 1564]